MPLVFIVVYYQHVFNHKYKYNHEYDVHFRAAILIFFKCLINQSIPHSRKHTHTHLPTHPLTHTPTYPHTHLPTHPLTHTPTYPHPQPSHTHMHIHMHAHTCTPHYTKTIKDFNTITLLNGFKLEWPPDYPYKNIAILYFLYLALIYYKTFHTMSPSTIVRLIMN